MLDETARRVARSQALFRETNEAIERGQWPGEAEKVVRFRCECSRPDCSQAVEVALEDYEQVRAHSKRFILTGTHVTAEVEDVVNRGENYVVVEKRGLAGEVSDATDPRT